MADTDDVEKKFIEPIVEEVTSQRKTLEDFLELRWYCLMVLVMAEVAAFTALASVTLMVFAGASPTVVGCGATLVSNCHEYHQLKNETDCAPVIEYQFVSLQVEFNHVCNDAKKVKNTITVQTFGVLIGAAVFGQFSDNFGRRKALLVSALGNSIFSVIAAYSPNLTMFMFWRTVAGVFAGGLTVVQMVFMIENIPRKHRMWIQNSITWSPNLIIFPVIAYYSKNWRTLSIVVGIASFLSFLALLLLHESPRWLIQKGRVAEARDILVRVRKTDGLYDSRFETEIDEALDVEREKLAKSNRAHSKKYTFVHLFCTWKMMAQSMTFILGIICTTFIVYALLYNMEKLSGSLYWNSAIIGVSRWVVNLAVSVIDYKFEWFGRRIVNILSMTCTAISLGIMTTFVYLGHAGSVQAIGTTVALAMCSQLFIAKYLMVNELYPTAVRNLAVSAVSTFSRVGSMFSPQLFYLSDYGSWVPYAVLLGMQTFDLILFCSVLPETKGVQLENHLPPKHKRIFGKRT